MENKITLFLCALLFTTVNAQEEKQKTIWFSYKDTPLTEVVNDIATLKKINVLLPQGTTALTSKVTFELPHKITLSKAWHYIITFLDIAGFTLIANNDVIHIVRNDKNTNKEPLPLYMSIDAEKLPDTETKIRYLKYLSYLQVPGTASGSGSGTLQEIFSQTLSSESSVVYEPKLNAVVISDKASNIKSAIKLVTMLDASATVEHPAFIKLKHTSASQVKALFDELLNQKSGQNSGFGGGFQPSSGSKNGSEGGFFNKTTKIVAEDRLNTLILLGKKDALKKIEDFITTYIDVPQQEGESVLHVYDLQYLKAQDFLPILQNIVQNQSSGGGGYGSQSTSSSNGNIGQQYFKDVIITIESNNGDQGSGSSNAQTGNKLIIAALKDDWIRIKKLIKQLDKPQEQVIITGLIVDLTHTALKDFANQVRNYKDYFLKNVNWQTGHIAGIENESSTGSANPTDSSALMANLLPSGDSSSGYGSGNIASNATAGTFIMSFKDIKSDGIWWVSSILSSHTDSKILSQPFLTTMNNKQVVFSDQVQRRVSGQASEKYGVAVSAQEDISAQIELTITPHINNNGSINLTINSDISEFEGTASDTRTTRNIVTNVNIKDKDILVLGGLTKTKVENTVYKTPLIGDIPLIGNIFKKKKKTKTKSNLMLFLRTEIIKPFDKSIMKRYYKKANMLLEKGEENFCNLKDPITKWFFNGVDNSKQLEKFVEKDHSSHLHAIKKTIVKMPKIKKSPGEKSKPKKEINIPANTTNEAEHPFAQEELIKLLEKESKKEQKEEIKLSDDSPLKNPNDQKEENIRSNKNITAKELKSLPQIVTKEEQEKEAEKELINLFKQYPELQIPNTEKN